MQNEVEGSVLHAGGGLVGTSLIWVPLGDTVTWLILPVVFCLSQRSSRACLSLSNKQRNCEWLIKSVIVYLLVPYYMDNCGDPELIPAEISRLLEETYLLDPKPIARGPPGEFIITAGTGIT